MHEEDEDEEESDSSEEEEDDDGYKFRPMNESDEKLRGIVEGGDEDDEEEEDGGAGDRIIQFLAGKQGENTENKGAGGLESQSSEDWISNRMAAYYTAKGAAEAASEAEAEAEAEAEQDLIVYHGFRKVRKLEGTRTTL